MGKKLQDTNLNIKKLLANLEKVSKIPQAPTAFKWNVARTLVSLEGWHKTYTSFMSPHPRMQDFERARLSAVRDHALRDEEGNIVMEVPDRVKLDPEKQDSWVSVMNRISAEYADALAFEQARSGIDQEMSEVELYQISMSDVPDSLTAEDRYLLWPMWKDLETET